MKIFKIEIPKTTLVTFFVKVEDNEGEKEALVKLTEYLTYDYSTPISDDVVNASESRGEFTIYRSSWDWSEVTDSEQIKVVSSLYFDEDEDDENLSLYEEIYWEGVDSEEDDDDDFYNDIRDIAGL